MEVPRRFYRGEAIIEANRYDRIEIRGWKESVRRTRLLSNDCLLDGARLRRD
jgi:hypothetical protein